MLFIGPLPKTTIDFWRLVWQERVHSIVMVTNVVERSRKKCEMYWPDSGSVCYGPFKVTITEQLILADYTTRNFLIEVYIFYTVFLSERVFYSSLGALNVL